MFSDFFVEGECFRGVSVEKGKLVELRADRAFEPADGIRVD